MQTLTATQRKYLRSLAHHLKPVVQVGKQGLTDALFTKIDQELDAHELIKVKFLEFHDQREAFAQTIVERSNSALVGIIGNVAILYREQADPARRTVLLPSGSGQ